jgi:hypothetical protein
MQSQIIAGALFVVTMAVPRSIALHMLQAVALQLELLLTQRSCISTNAVTRHWLH